MAATDKKTDELLTEIDALIQAAEDQWAGELGRCDTEEEASEAVDLAHLLSQSVKRLETRRTEKNATVRKTMSKNTAIFKPLIDRVEKLKGRIREAVLEYMLPGGKLGTNMDVEELRIRGEDAQASLSEVTTYEVTDVAAFAKAYPELMSPNMSEIKKRFAKGEALEHVEAKDDYQLRIA